jgi:hypothetical protein
MHHPFKTLLLAVTSFVGWLDWSAIDSSILMPLMHLGSLTLIVIGVHGAIKNKFKSPQK